MDIVKDFSADITDLFSHYINRLLQPIYNAINNTLHTISAYTWMTIKLWILGIVSLIVLLCTLIISTFLYIVFYNIMIPVHTITAPVQFDYTATPHYITPQPHLHHAVVQQPSTVTPYIQQPVQPVQYHIQPTATVALTEQQWKYTVNATYIDNHPAQELYAYSSEYDANEHRLLYGGQSYNIELWLNIPYNENNKHIGMTSVTSDIYHLDYKLATAVNSFLPIPYTNDWIQTLWRLVWSPLLVTGLKSETHTIKLLLFDNYYEHSTSYSTHIQLTLSSLHAHALQLYDATLQFTVQLYGIRYLMYYWKYTVAAAVILTMTAIQCTFVFVFMLIVYVKLVLNTDKNYVPDLNDTQYRAQYRRKPAAEQTAHNNVHSRNPSMAFKYNSAFDAGSRSASQPCTIPPLVDILQSTASAESSTMPSPVNAQSHAQSVPPPYSHSHAHRSASPTLENDAPQRSRPVKAQPAFHYNEQIDFEAFLESSSDDNDSEADGNILNEDVGLRHLTGSGSSLNSNASNKGKKAE